MNNEIDVAAALEGADGLLDDWAALYDREEDERYLMISQEIKKLLPRVRREAVIKQMTNHG